MTKHSETTSALQKISVVVKGKEMDDLIQGLEEVLRLLNEGFTSAANRNDTGSFSFIVLENPHE